MLAFFKKETGCSWQEFSWRGLQSLRNTSFAELWFFMLINYIICHWSLRKSGFLRCTVNVCCFRCAWEENVVLDPHCLGFASLQQVHVPKLRLGYFFWKSLPQPVSLMNGWKQLQWKEIWGVQEGNRDIAVSRLERLWGAMVTIFTFFCLSLLIQMVYQGLLDCAKCFQSLSVSIIIAFFHVGRNYGRSQCISISLFNQISAISSNPADKA